MNTSHDLPGQPSEAPNGPAAPHPLPPTGSAKFFHWIRGLGIQRGPNRWIGGVCAGLGQRWGIDPVIIRGLAVVLTLFFGVGLLAYGVAWALLPEPDGRIHVEEVGRGHWSTGMTGAAVAIMLGMGGSGSGAFSRNGDWSFWTVLWIGAAAWAIYWAFNRDKAKKAAKASGEHWSGSVGPVAEGSGQHWPGPDPSGQYGPGQEGSGPEGSGQGQGQSWYGHTRQQSGWKGAAWQGSQTAHGPAAAQGSQVSQGPGRQAAPPYNYSFTPDPGHYVKQRTARTTPRLGAAASLLVIGAAAVVGAAILLLNTNNVIDLGGHGAAVAAAAAAITAGLGILTAGIAGRTAGGLGTFAIIALVAAGALSLPQHDISAFNDANWAPTSVSAAQTGRTILVGNGTVDLTMLNIPAKPTSDVQIPLNVVASNVTIMVPDNIPVELKSELAAASLTINGQANGKGLVEKTVHDINPEATGHGLVITLQGAATNVDVHVIPAP